MSFEFVCGFLVEFAKKETRQGFSFWLDVTIRPPSGKPRLAYFLILLTSFNIVLSVSRRTPTNFYIGV